MTPRRDFLGFTTTPFVMADEAHNADRSSPDAELLYLAEQFITNERLIHAEPCDAEPQTPEAHEQDQRMRELVGVQHAITLQLGTLHATTSEGLAALARCLATHNAERAFSLEARDTTAGRLVSQIIRDATLVDAATTARPSPDAELLEACAAFDQLEHAYIAICRGLVPGSPQEEAAEAEQDRLYQAQAPLVDRMIELRAVTREGQAARARSLALWDAELMKAGTGDTGQRLTYAIVRDLIGGAA